MTTRSSGIWSASASTHYEIVEAANGEEGLVQARRAPPDLIVLDLRDAGHVGRPTSSRELAADAATREIPVVVLTSAQLDDSRAKDNRERTRPPSFPRTRSRPLTRTTV